MKGIECAFFGVIGSESIELRTSRGGNAWASFNIGVMTAVTDDGKDVLTWLRVSCFGDTAERVASSFKKGDRAYIEGNLKLDHWQDKQGEQKHGLSVSAFKVEKVGVSAIGRNKPKRESSDSGPGMASFAGSIHRQAPRVTGRDDFNDQLPI
jgi:single-strand DNA-binding protein